MPSDVLTARAFLARNSARLVFDQLLGDHPIMDGDDESSVYEWVMSEGFHYALERLARFGVSNLAADGNVISFDFAEGLNVLELIAQTMMVVAEAHRKIPFVILPTEVA